MKLKKRWYLYGLIGLIFGIIDWFYLDLLAFGLSPSLPENPFIAIPVMIALNYGIWLVPIIPVTVYESRRADSIKGADQGGDSHLVLCFAQLLCFLCCVILVGQAEYGMV